MAQKFGCRDLGVDCEYEVDITDMDTEEVARETIKHARVAHPEFNQQLPELQDKIRSTVDDLKRQSKFLQQS